MRLEVIVYVFTSRLDVMAMSKGYIGHFTGAYICYECGALCDCGDDSE